MTLALAAAGHATGRATAGTGRLGEAAVVAGADGLQEAAARFERDHRRDSIVSQRGAKQPLVLFALVAVLLAVSCLAVQRARARRQPRPSLTSRWVRNGGRAPPRFQLSVV